MIEKKRNFFLAAGTVLGILLITGLLFDYYYALNDDVLIKDILAGVQTGTPNGYSVQMLYPISVFISLFYKIGRGVSWYGLFLCACHYGSLFFVIYRSLFMVKGKKGRSAVLLFGAVLTGGLFWWELVYVQYTVTCALLAGMAAFWLYTTPEGYETKRFIQYNTVTITAILLAFYIRTEMLLLLLPLLGAAGLNRLLEEEKIVKAFKKYALTAGIVLAGMGLGMLLHTAAYRSGEWQEFNRFFDARTQVYDFYFYDIPDYEGNETVYEEMGIDKAQYELIQNYNFGIDSGINADKLETLQEYAKEAYHNNHPVKSRVKEALWQYAHLLTDREDSYFKADYPWNIMVFIGYTVVCLTIWAGGKRKPIWQLFILAVMRHISWGYILYRGRMPERITHSLYLVELLILLAVLLRVKCETGQRQKYVKGLAFLILALAALWQLPGMYQKVETEQQIRTEKNEAYAVLQEYCKEHEGNYYYVDVLSTVDFSEKMFQKTDNSMRNYDIIGGWLCKSPISLFKPFEYFITEKGDDITWLLPYYEMEKTEEFGTKSGAAWTVYRRIDK